MQFGEKADFLYAEIAPNWHYNCAVTAADYYYALPISLEIKLTVCMHSLDLGPTATTKMTLKNARALTLDPGY